MLKIKKSDNLAGEVTISGSKNAVLPIMAAALLIRGQTTLSNVPDILDVHDFIHFFESLWAVVSFQNNVINLDATHISLDNMDTSKIARTRAGIYFIAGLLSRFKEANIPFPTWDKIGKRPIDEHVNGYVNMGYDFEESSEMLHFRWVWSSQDVSIDWYFAVSATANLILWAVSRRGVTTINLCAFEPHIFNLIDFLRTAGIQIDVRYDHTIIVHGWTELSSKIEHTIISDYLQSWTFAIIAALASKDYLDIVNARISDLGAFLYKLHEAGVKTQDLWNDTLRVFRADKLQAVKIQTNIFPGFPTDLMPLFTVLMTQSEGVSIVHEILYEARLNWLVEYEILWGNIDINNPHQAQITGPTQFTGWTVNSWDLRAGAAMVIAWLIATWETTVQNVYWIKRGYDNLIWKLQDLGADIEEIE